MTQLLLLRHLQSLLYTIIQKPHVIPHRHLTEGTGASEAGLILQRSILKATHEQNVYYIYIIVIFISYMYKYIQ